MTKKIAYLIQYFGDSDNSLASTRSYDFANEWAKSGHEVWVICSNAYFLDKNKQIKGLHPKVQVSIINLDYRNEYNIFLRIKAFISFAIKAFFLLISSPNKFDIIYASSTPMTTGIIASIVSKITQCKWIYEIRDIWPDFPIEITRMKNRWIIQSLRKIEVYLYESANKIIVLNPDLKKVISERAEIDTKTIHVVPNGFSEYLIPEKVQKKKNPVISYCGALGFANNIDWLITVFDLILEEHNTAEIVIVGYGRFENKVNKWLESNGNEHRITFYTNLSKRDSLKMMSKSDISLVSFLNIPSLKYLSLIHI